MGMWSVQLRIKITRTNDDADDENEDNEDTESKTSERGESDDEWK